MQLLIDTLRTAFVPLAWLAIGYLLRCHREPAVDPPDASEHSTKTKEPPDDQQGRL